MKEQTLSTTVVIAGMGIAGLTTAVELAQKGTSFIIIEPRESFTRGMVVKLNMVTYQYLLSLKDNDDPKDQIFFSTLENDRIVQVKDIQKFLLRKLENLSQKESNNGKITILRGEKYQLSKIDPATQMAAVLIAESDQTIKTNIHFNHFVAADGSRHQVVDLFNESVPNEEDKIKYERQMYQPRQAATGTISMQLKEGIEVRQPKGQFTPKHFPALRALGWNKPFFPKAYAFLQDPNSKKNKYFIVGEIPERIEQMQDKRKQRIALQAWGRLIMHVKNGYDYYDLNIINKQVKQEKKDIPFQRDLIEEKNQLQATTFRLELFYAAKSTYQMNEGGTFAILGDSFKGANPFLVHGANDAILDGVFFARNLKNDSPMGFDLRGFNELRNKQFQQFQSLMKKSKK